MQNILSVCSYVLIEQCRHGMYANFYPNSGAGGIGSQGTGAGGLGSHRTGSHGTGGGGYGQGGDGANTGTGMLFLQSARN